MSKRFRIFFIVILFFTFMNIFNINSSVSAFDGEQLSLEKGIKISTINPNKYKPTDPTTGEATKVVNKVKIILGAIRNITVVVSVISLMIIGFKYIIGSVEEKANYKATLLPYVIGFVIAISGTTIVSFIYNAMHE